MYLIVDNIIFLLSVKWFGARTGEIGFRNDSGHIISLIENAMVGTHTNGILDPSPLPLYASVRFWQEKLPTLKIIVNV